MNTLLNKSDIIYLLTQQNKLDQAMREQLNISESDWMHMHMEHSLALNVELHEFINACFKSWKYWKRKDMNMDDVLDEAIDVIHFCMLRLNKSTAKTEFIASNVESEIQDKRQLEDRGAVKRVIYHLSNGAMSAESILGYVLSILDYYGFTAQDIINQYNKKNTVNFRRLASGY